ncbi:MAG: FtsW/RodA/SpoVE family cell cycle protein, partial [Neomegalonema sp.]|nr:FtsW/RodA/SpoVE family cell cycle protein [Neomegalonema sp.]
HLGLPTLPMFAGESATALYSAAALFGIIGVGVYKAPTLGLSWRMAPLGGLIVIFLAWFGFGGEEGLAAIQPAELGKLAAIIFIAVALVAIQRRRESLTPVLPIGVFFGYMAALVLFGALFVVIPTLKSDYSPVLIIGLSTVTVLLAAGASSILALLVGPTALRLLGGLARRVRMGPRPFAAPTTLPDYFAPRIAGGQKNVWVARLAGLIAPILRISATAIALLIILFALLRVWQPYFASEYEEARTKLEPYIVSDGVAVLAKRALSYRDLAYVRWEEAKSKTPPAEENLVDYEDLGLQVIRSRLAMATAPCTAFGRNLLWGCDEKSASAPLLGANPPSVMRIPAVEDDFAAAFYVSRFGVEASVGLAIAQAALIALLFLFAARLRRLTPGDRREDTIRQLMANLTIGAGALFALHWFISWSNIFGLLPVMGQPMTFMSLGTSHHIFMAYPLIMIGILAARFAESAPDEELKLFEPPQLGPQSMVRR